jgi:hypothetical protein
MKRTIETTVVAMMFVSFLLNAACSTTDSENVKTSGIWAHYVVDHYPDDEVRCLGVLRVGGSTGTIVDMSGGEHLECNGLEMSEFFDPITNYRWNRVIMDPDPQNLYDIDFVRTDEVVSTTVEVAEPPYVDGTEPAGLVYGGEALTVFWDPTYPGDSVNIHLSGTCIDDLSDYGVLDDGEYTFNAVTADPEVGGDCVIDITVSRVFEDSVNPAFEGGYTESYRIEDFSIDFEEFPPP